MTSPSNKRLYEALGRTDPKYTKDVKIGRKFTAINSQWQNMRMTEYFGPIGIGWGCEYERQIHETADGKIYYTVTCTVWYVDPETGVKAYVPGRTAMCIVRDGKWDEDAPKKAETEALSKSLSMIGMSADVFMGLFDDDRYVAHAREEAAKPKATPKMTAAPATLPEGHAIAPAPFQRPEGLNPDCDPLKAVAYTDADLTKATPERLWDFIDTAAMLLFGIKDYLHAYATTHSDKRVRAWVGPENQLNIGVAPVVHLERIAAKLRTLAPLYESLYKAWPADYALILARIPDLLRIDTHDLEQLVYNGLAEPETAA